MTIGAKWKDNIQEIVKKVSLMVAQSNMKDKSLISHNILEV